MFMRVFKGEKVMNGRYNASSKSFTLTAQLCIPHREKGIAKAAKSIGRTVEKARRKFSDGLLC